MDVGCMTFGMKRRKKTKKYVRDNGLQGWNVCGDLEGFQLSFISKDIWAQYIHHVMSEQFTRCSQFGTDNQNRQIHSSVTTYTGDSVPFIAHVKRMIRLILMTSIFN
jgi:hypothetical protein